MAETTTVTTDEAAAALKAGAWTHTPGLDDAAPRLLAAVDAVWDLCHDESGNWLPDGAKVSVRDLSAALELAGQLPKQRTIVHCRAGGIGADWDLDAALTVVASAQSAEWSRSLFGHDLLVIGADGQAYRFEVAMPGREL